MKTPFYALMTTVLLTTTCLVSIGAVVFGEADTFNKVLFPILALAATWRGCSAVLRDAIAMETQRAETTGSVAKP